MPEVIIGFIVKAIGGAAATVGIGLSSVTPFLITGKQVLTFGLIAGTNAVLSAVRKKPNANNLQAAQGTTITARGSSEPARIVYGRPRFGGVLYPIASTGQDNEFYHFIVIWAGHQMESIDEIWFNEELIEIDGSGNATGRFKDYVRIKHHLGTDTQAADSDMVAEITDWTTAHQGKRIAYSTFRFRWSQELFRTNYNITCVGKGRKIRSEVQDLTEYSDNAIRVIHDYITNQEGLSLGVDPATRIDKTLFAAAESDCTDLITYYPEATFTADPSGNTIDHTGHSMNDGDGWSYTTTGTPIGGLTESTLYWVINATANDFQLALNPGDSTPINITSAGTPTHTYNRSEFRYTINGVILSNELPRNVLPELLAACGGSATRSGGKWRLYAGVSQTATVELDESDLRGPLHIEPALGGAEIFNRVRGLFISPQHNYNATDFPTYRRWTDTVFTDAEVDVANDEFDMVAHGYENLDILRMRLDKAAASTLPTTTPAGDFAEDTDYYVRNKTNDTFQLSKTTTGPVIVIAGDPTGNNYLRQERFVKDDNGVPLYEDLALRFTNSADMAERLAKLLVETARQEQVLHWPGRLQGLKVRANEWVKVTNSINGWNEKLYQVKDLALEVYDAETDGGGDAIPTLGTNLVLREVAAAAYNFSKDDDNVIHDPAPNTDLPDADTVPTPANPTISSSNTQALKLKDGTFIPRIKITWDQTTNHFVLSGGLVEIQWRKRDVKTIASVTPGTDRINITNHGFPNGREVRVRTDGTLPDPLETDVFYFVVNATTNDFQLSTVRNGDAVDLTDSGSGVHTVVYQPFLKHYLDGDSVEHYIDGVEEADVYDVRWRFLNRDRVPGGWRADNDHTIQADSTAPAVPTNVSITYNDPLLMVSWDWPTDKDLAGVQIETREPPDPFEEGGYEAGNANSPSGIRGQFSEFRLSGTYEARVRSRDRSGNNSSWSSTVST